MSQGAGRILNNRYRIVRMLGQGGFGAVYEAWDLRLDRACAVKENLGPAETSRQFEREARILANLTHPNLPRVIDHFEILGQGQYLVMDLIPGKDLQELVEERGGPIAESQAVSWILQATEALEYLHEQTPPIIHRDIKPANIILSPNGTVFLVDFGLSKIHDPQQKTTLGAFGVSPGYSPQEQYGRGKTDVRSDIYALGATLYCLLTGIEPPESVQRNLGAALTPPRAFSTSIPVYVENAVLKAMEMQPVKRFQNVRAFKSALSGVIQPTTHWTQQQLATHPYVSGGGAGLSQQRMQFPRVLLVGLLVTVFLLALLVGFALFERNLRTSGRLSGLYPADTTPSGVLSVNESTLSPPAQPRWTAVADLPLQPGRLPEVYTVAPGDTCSQLAERFGTTTEEIWRLNHFPGDCDQLFSGHKLLIPPVAEDDSKLLPTAESELLPSETVRQSAKDGMLMVHISAGVFWRGSGDLDPQSRPDEKPFHAVYLDAFWIDQTEVTNVMYIGCVREGVCAPPAQVASRRNLVYFGQQAFNDYPVIYVTWKDADRYCRWAGRRLPTEAEWEKAARGTDGRIFPWGNERASRWLANFDQQVGDTTRAGSYPAGASPFGVLDLAGNVAEWVADWFAADYYQSAPVVNPPGPPTGEFRVQRGGSWLSQAHAIRSAYRLWNYPDSSFEGIGFRCALSEQD